MATQHILIVDDDNESRAKISEALASAGYRTTCSASTAQATKLINDQPPDLIISDIRLRDRNGFGGLRHVRGDTATAAIPFIIISDQFEPKVMRQAMDFGADDFLIKPLDPNQIVASVDARLHRVEAVQEGAASARQRLVNMVNDTPVLIALCDAATARFEFINGPGCEMLGLNPNADLSNRHFHDCIGNLPAGDLLTQVGATGSWHGDATMQTAGGRSIPVSLWITAHGSASKPVDYISVIAADITKRCQAEDALRQNEALLRGITCHATEAISVLDDANHVVWNNPAYDHTLGADASAKEAPSAFDRIHPEDRALVQTALEQARENGTSDTYAFRVPGTGADDSTRYFEAIATRTTLENGPDSQLIQIARDITERINNERERALEHLNQTHAQKLESIGQLAAGIAHEINTPIQFVGDNLRFLRDSFSEFGRLTSLLQDLVSAQPDDVASLIAQIRTVIDEIDLPFLQEEIPEALEQSIEGVQRVAKLVKAMKVFAHPGGAEMAPADLNGAIRNTVEVSRNEWKYVAEIDLQLDPDLGTVPCIIGEISQVILNLVVNAAHAITSKLGRESGQKGWITITTHRREGHAVISVRDTGTGIEKAVQERLFEPFFTTKPVGQGTGQGLAIARAVVVEKHGGTIDIDSTPGEGSCFIVRLPLEAQLRKSA